MSQKASPTFEYDWLFTFHFHESYCYSASEASFSKKSTSCGYTLQ